MRREARLHGEFGTRSAGRRCAPIGSNVGVLDDERRLVAVDKGLTPLPPVRPGPRPDDHGRFADEGGRPPTSGPGDALA